MKSIIKRITGEESRIQTEFINRQAQDINNLCLRLKSIVESLDGKCTTSLQLHHLQEAKQYLNENKSRFDVLQKEDV